MKETKVDNETKAAETPAADGGTPFIAKIVPAPDPEVENTPEPVKVPRGKTGLVYGGPADAVILADGQRVLRGDTVVVSGDDVEAVMGLGGFTEAEAPADADEKAADAKSSKADKAKKSEE